ncbi:MAG: branched-chain amino acid transaminase [Candidatus Micrarchaeota archaeon]|nr:branched-chain amino acid transaminase [Candidatus Micrarchaeota archaeon]
MAKKNQGAYFWLDGKMVKSKDAKVPILTHSMQYGSGIFEGMRAYKTQNGTAIFRLDDHVKRFFRSAKVYGMKLGYAKSDIRDAIIKVVKQSRLESCYIRPFAFYNDDNIGISTHGKRISVFVAAVPFGAYFGKGKERGIRCRISSWQRINSLILPPEAKASGNYINSIIANMDAIYSGADEAILTSLDGYVAEGPGENIFIVEEGKLVTPSREADILLGITRESIMMLAKRIGIDVVERNIHKEELYTCDEAFFAGTAAEITPITSIDSRGIGTGRPGRITNLLAGEYTKAVTGKIKEYENWLTYV